MLKSIVAILTFTLLFNSQSAEQTKPIDPANMDTSVKPGDDFYQYANGKWIELNPIPADESRWGSFEECIERSRRALHELMENAARQSDAPKGSPTQMVGDFYASAMDEERVERDGAKPLDDEMKRIAAIASATDLQDAMAHFQTMGMHVPFALYADQDAKQSTEVIVEIGQSGLGLPDREYYTDKDESLTKMRGQYVAHVARMFELLGDEKSAAAAQAATILAIETQLANASLTRVQRREPEANYHKRPYEKLAELTPNISWDRLYEGMGIADRRAVNVEQPDFFAQLNTMMKSVPIADWKTYLRWHLLNHSASLLNKAFVEEDFAFNAQILTGAKELKPRWKRVLALVDHGIPDAVGQLYVAKYFSPDAKANALRLVGNLRAELRERIQKLDWMSAVTKTQALRKLDAFTVKIGYPDTWRDYASLVIDRGPTILNALRVRQFEFRRNIKKLGQPVDRGEWHMSAPTVNAYYNQSLNEIVFPAAILQPPFFDAKADDAVNYGGIGAVIGHEMSHGFDDKGRKSDADGNLKDWWTPEDVKNYEARSSVVQKQFDDYVAIDAMHINGALTLGENIADLGGVSIAYGALQKALEGKPREKIDGFTPEQRFFLSYAQVWRNSIRPQALKMRLRTDPHSPGRFRCNGPLSNLKEFMQAFDIKEGEPMARPADQRVRIF